MTIQTLTLARPDDWHVHLRDGALLATTVPATVRCFGRAIVMPNLQPPITTVAAAAEYRARILSQIPANCDFTPLMTLYLTENMSTQEIIKAKQSGCITACKLYPAGATTHSAAGIADIQKIYPLLAEMEKQDLPLLIHGEVIDEKVDIFDREKIFIERELTQLLRDFPGLRMVLEHISTAQAAEFVSSAPPNLAATITVHHLLLNRNDLFAGGLRPHYYCLPVVKQASDQQALIAAAISGNPKFFLGTDSAPHSRAHKETACCPAGIFTAHAALELCAEFFEQQQALIKLEAFVSFFGADFYRLPRNQARVTLQRKAQTAPQQLAFGEDILIPFFAGKTLHWSLLDETR